MRDRVLRLMDWRVIATASVLAMGPTVAPAQQPAAPTAGAPAGWNKICYADPTGAQACTVLFQIVAETGQLVEPNMVFQAWIINQQGIYVGAGIRITVDANAPTDIPFAICDATYCIAERQIDNNFVNALKAGNNMSVSALIRQPNGQPQQVDLPVTLRGFTAAFDGPGLDQAQAAALTEQLNQALQDRAAAARQRLIQQQQQFATPPTP
jgi:invasion protein IalB